MQKYLQNGASVISRQVQRLDIIANNLANMNTTGYKAQEIAFCDIVNDKTLNNVNLTESVAKKARTSRDFAQGVIAKSENPYSIAIEGRGYFRVKDADGNDYYTRDGNFHKDAQGRLMHPAGYYLEGIDLPDDTQKVYIRSDGSVDYQNFQGDINNAGQINLYLFNSPQELKAVGGNLFTAGELSGEPQEFTPGGDEVARLKQGGLESSNTNWTMEMVNLIQTQRTISMSSQSITKTADQLWEMANNLRR